MTTVLDCGHKGRDYGSDSDGKKYCYPCCGLRDRERMIRDGKTTLYLTGSTLSNWPGSFNLTVRRVRVGKHNFAGKRYDVWFTGPDGKEWHGVQYGDQTQICHCRRSN